MSQILWNFLRDNVFLGSAVCYGCLTKAKNFEPFQSEMKESVNNIKLTTQTKRLINESPKVAHKTQCQRTTFKDLANTPEIRKMLFKVEPTSETKSKPTIVHKVHSSTQTDNIEEGISVVMFAFLSIFSINSAIILALNAPIATKVICFSRLLKCLRSLYDKQGGPISDCSYRSSLF